MSDTLTWIEAGRRFGFDDLVFWRGKPATKFAAVAGRIDTVVFGPHASAAFPAELRPFVSPALTRRKQYDYSDVITSAVGRAWAEADDRVVYVENPHSRLVMDPNRSPITDAGPGLREFFARLARQRAGEKIGFGGVDTVRPVTFSGETVLLEPDSDAGWDALIATLNRCAEQGPNAYAAVRDEVVEQVLAARPSGQALHVLSLHDTMNTQMREDGAITRERPVADRLPAVANFGNRGDARGEKEQDEISISATEARRVVAAYAAAWGVTDEASVTLNAPYKGAYETVLWGGRLRALGELQVGMLQVEFLRETLLGPRATAELHQAGEGWPAVDQAHLAEVVGRLVEAGRLLRSAP